MGEASTTIGEGPAPIDWAARWRAMVEARAAQVTRLRRTPAGPDHWASRARGYQSIAGVAGQDDPVVGHLRPWLTPRTRLLDVGAGTGRYALALAPYVREVVAVEPSAGMAELLMAGARERGIANLRLIPARWEEVRGEEADVVLSAHVLYPIAEVAPFLRALDAAARRICVLALRLTPPGVLLREAWLALHGEEPRYDPTFLEAYNVLWQIGIPANVRLVPSELRLSFEGREAALGWARDMLWAEESEEINRRLLSYLEPLLLPQPDGRLAMLPASKQAAIVWWERDSGGPRGR